MNFDESMTLWRENKIPKGNGYFIYRCSYVHTNGKNCVKPSNYILLNACTRHVNKLKRVTINE